MKETTNINKQQKKKQTTRFMLWTFCIYHTFYIFRDACRCFPSSSSSPCRRCRAFFLFLFDVEPFTDSVNTRFSRVILFIILIIEIYFFRLLIL